jgi:hypothetical protein
MKGRKEGRRNGKFAELNGKREWNRRRKCSDKDVKQYRKMNIEKNK